MIVDVASVLSARKRFIGKLSKTNWILTFVHRVQLSFIDCWVTNSFKIHNHILIIKNILRFCFGSGFGVFAVAFSLALWWRHSAGVRHSRLEISVFLFLSQKSVKVTAHHGPEFPL